VGRLSCQSSLLSHPNGKIFCGNLVKATQNNKRTKRRRGRGPDIPNATKTEIKQRRAATSALTFMTFS
jgi:hypothetical protein